MYFPCRQASTGCWRHSGAERRQWREERGGAAEGRERKEGPMARRAATMPHSHGKIGSFVAADSIRSAPAINCRGLAHSVAAPLRKKARSARLLGCKRPRDGSRSLPPFFGWRPARGWIAGRALRGQRAGPNVRVADCDRAGLQQDQGVLPAAGRRKGPWLAKWGRGMAKEICWIWETH